MATMRDQLAEVLDGRVEVESVVVREEVKVVVVTIRLPELSEAERLRLEEWVQIRFERVQDGGEDGYVLAPHYV